MFYVGEKSLPQKKGQKRTRIGFQGASDIDKFDRIEAPFAAFVLCDKGLRPAEPASDLHLSELL